MGTKDILNSIGMGERMRRYRVAVSKTQHEVADEVGIATSSYANYENGNRVPKYSVLEKIAKSLGVTVTELVTEDSATNAIEQILKLSPRASDVASFIAAQEPNMNDAIKFALWGGDKELSQDDIDALWNDVRDYVAFKTQQRKKDKTPPPEDSGNG